MMASYCSISHLAKTICPTRSWGKLQMAEFTACFDASGSPHDPATPFLAVAGFLSSADSWIEFSESWKVRLAEDGLEYFHMVDFAQSTNHFEGWRPQEPRRQKLLGDLVDLIKSHAFQQFGQAVRLSEHNEYLDDRFKEEFHLTAYTLAARTCAGYVRRWLEGEGLDSTQFTLVFEEGDLGQDKLKKRLEDDGFGVNFRPKTDRIRSGMLHRGFIPLQAADIWAYEFALLAKRNSVDRWAADQLMRMTGRTGIYTKPDIQALNRELSNI